MTFEHLDTAFAFAAVMLGLSLLITLGTQIVISLLGLRGSNLRRSLVDLFETACQDPEAKHHAKEIARRVLRHPIISDSVFAHLCVRADRVPLIPAETAGKLQWAGSAIPLLPWIVGAVAGFFIMPVALAMIKRLLVPDVCKYWDFLSSNVPVLNVCQHPRSAGAILGAVFVGLFSRWRLATSIRVEELLAVLEKLSNPLPGTLPDPVQRAMLLIAWTENEPGPKAKPVPADRLAQSTLDFNARGVGSAAKLQSVQSDRIAQKAQDFDEGIVRHAQAHGEPMTVAAEKAMKQVDDPDAEGAAVAAENTGKQSPTRAEPRLEGLRAWFDHAMERASQRFTLEARVLTVALSLLFVFAAHLDAIRLIRMLSSDAQWRAQLTASAEALSRQAERTPRTKEGTRTVVPDVYRKAMAAILRPIPAVAEPTRPRRRSAARGAVLASPSASQLSPDGLTVPTEAQGSPTILLAAMASTQDAAAAPQTTLETPAKKEETSPTPARKRAPAREREKISTAPAPREDPSTALAKATAEKALEARPGFASREDAVAWLRSTLPGNPALENLAAEYDQEVNAQLVSDTDKLIDQSASLKRNLVRSEFQLLPDKWPGWRPINNELPGLLVSVAFLSLGAPFWYNALKRLASLRPQPAISQDLEHKRHMPA